MSKVKSVFSPIQVFLIPLCLLVFTLGLGGVLIFSAFNAKDDRLILAIAGAVFALLGPSILYSLTKQFISISIDERGIGLKSLRSNRSYLWSDIKEINLTGKGLEKILFSSLFQEGICLELKNGETEILFVKYYDNMDEIRSALHLVRKQLQENQRVNLDSAKYPTKLHKINVDDFSLFKRFSGNHFLSFNGIMIYAVILFSIWLITSSDSVLSTETLLLLTLSALFFFYGIFGSQLHYFLMDHQYLIVKNHVWFWRTHKYHLLDLQEAVFEIPHQKSTSLRIITIDYKTKLYSAGSLRNRTWRKFVKALEQAKVEIRNEAIDFDENEPE